MAFFPAPCNPRAGVAITRKNVVFKHPEGMAFTYSSPADIKAINEAIRHHEPLDLSALRITTAPMQTVFVGLANDPPFIIHPNTLRFRDTTGECLYIEPMRKTGAFRFSSYDPKISVFLSLMDYGEVLDGMLSRTLQEKEIKTLHGALYVEKQSTGKYRIDIEESGAGRTAFFFSPETIEHFPNPFNVNRLQLQDFSVDTSGHKTTLRMHDTEWKVPTAEKLAYALAGITKLQATNHGHKWADGTHLQLVTNGRILTKKERREVIKHLDITTTFDDIHVGHLMFDGQEISRWKAKQLLEAVENSMPFNHSAIIYRPYDNYLVTQKADCHLTESGRERFIDHLRIMTV